jgi:hypothetical protein
MLITDVILSEDGHAQERSLIPAVLQRVEADQLWIEDRNFCTLGLLFGMPRRGAAFVVRQHGQLQGELLGRAQRAGTTRSGSVYEQAMSLEISRTYDGMMIAIPAPHWALFRALSHQEFASALHELASSVDLSKYQKHPRGPKKKPPERAPYKHRQHVATAKLLAQR